MTSRPSIPTTSTPSRRRGRSIRARRSPASSELPGRRAARRRLARVGARRARCSPRRSSSASPTGCTEMAVAYAKERVQFDRPIGGVPGDQAPARRHARAHRGRARRRLRAPAPRLDEPTTRTSTAPVVAAPRSLAGEAAIANGKAATQVFGGMGFTWEVDVHLYLKRAWVLDTHFGSATATRDSSAPIGGPGLAAEPDATVRSMTRPQTTVLAALAQRLAIRSRRSVPRLRQRRRQRAVHGARDGRASRHRLAHALRGAGRRPRRPGRDAARQPRRAGRQLLRRAEARRGAGADQHRRTRASSSATSSPTRAPRCSSCRATSRRARSRSSATRHARRSTHCIVVDPPDAVIDAVPTIRGHDALAARQRRRRSTRATVRPGDLACFIYTAGTTGPSKGCMLPQNYIVSLADQIARAWERQPDDVDAHAAAAVPLQRDLGVRRRHAARRRQRRDRAPLLGEQLLARDQAHRRHDGEHARLARDPHRATPTTIPTSTGHKLRLCAAAPMPPDTDRAWQERFGCKTFSGGYGLTEASLDLDARRGRAEQARRVRASRTSHEFDVRLVDDDDVEVAAGEVGEIVCRPERPEPDVRRLLEPARRDRRGDAQPLVPHRRPRPHRRRRLSCTSSIARRTRCGGAARTSRASRWRRCLYGHDGDRRTSRCTRCRARSARTT